MVWRGAIAHGTIGLHAVLLRAEDSGPSQRVADAVDPGCPWTLYSPWRRWTMLSILFLVTTSNYFDYYVVSIVLDPIKQEFHVSDTMLGLLSGFSFAVLYAVAAIPIARWADRGDRRLITTLTLSAWSIMTVVCGLAGSFWQLVGARLGVAVTEPGAAPPAQSLIADYFPPQQRAMAAAVLAQGASAAGYTLGIGVGGYVAATEGWRAAFLWAGIPGVILAVVVQLFLSEPRRRLGFPSETRAEESFSEGIKVLREKRSFVLIVAGVTLFTFFAYGTGVFLPSFLIRVLHASLKEVSVTWGLIAAAAMGLGALTGGWLADRLSRRDVRWYAWLPAIAFGAATPLYWLTLSTHGVWGFIAADFPAEWILAVGYSVSFAAIHAVCGNRRRALAISIAYFCYMFIGCGFGPLIAGAISDALLPRYGPQSL
jgi:MFS family permease